MCRALIQFPTVFKVFNFEYLKPRGNCIYQLLQHQATLHVTTHCICAFLVNFYNEYRFPPRNSIKRFVLIKDRDFVFSGVGTEIFMWKLDTFPLLHVSGFVSLAHLTWKPFCLLSDHVYNTPPCSATLV